MTIPRRTLIRAAAGATLAGLGAPLFAQGATKLKVGYLHTQIGRAHV